MKLSSVPYSFFNQGGVELKDYSGVGSYDQAIYIAKVLACRYKTGVVVRLNHDYIGCVPFPILYYCIDGLRPSDFSFYSVRKVQE